MVPGYTRNTSLLFTVGEVFSMSRDYTAVFINHQSYVKLLVRLGLCKIHSNKNPGQH